jgi:Helix-turn-helix.
MDKFNNVLKELRLEKNISQRELASQLQLSKSSISMYESGFRHPNYETLAMIADYFGVDMNYLLGKTSIRNSYENADTIVSSKKPITNIEEAVQFLMAQPFITEITNIDIKKMTDDELIKASNIIAEMIRTGLKVIGK